MKAIKYSLKHLYKGTDQVTVTIQNSAAAECIGEQEAVVTENVAKDTSKGSLFDCQENV